MNNLHFWHNMRVPILLLYEQKHYIHHSFFTVMKWHSQPRMDKIFGCILPQSDNQNLLVIYCYFKVVIRIWLINDIYLLSQLQKPWSESKEKHTFSTEWMDFAELFKKKSLQIRYCRSTYYFLMCCIMSAASTHCRWHLCREMQCLASNWTHISTGKCELKYITNGWCDTFQQYDMS